MILQDIRYALRSLRRAPSFTLIALITLALGIGGTTAIFSVVDGILLKQLPFPDASAIISVSRTAPNGEGGAFSPADFLDYKQGSYTVAQRSPEIGVRLALGATPLQVGCLILGHGLALAASGVVLGLAGAIAATRLLEGLLFSVSTTDPTVFTALAGFLLAIAALACYVPARRAMRVDPVVALRSE